MAILFVSLPSLPSLAVAEKMCSHYDVTPARYEERTVEIVYEAHEQFRIIPWTYKERDEVIVELPKRCPGTTFIEERVVPEETEDRFRILPTTFKRVEAPDGTVRMIVDKPASVGRIPNHGYPRAIIRQVIDHQAECSPAEMLPEKTRLVTRRVVDTPASVSREWIPETTKTITERVIVEPATNSLRDSPCVAE